MTWHEKKRKTTANDRKQQDEVHFQAKALSRFTWSTSSGASCGSRVLGAATTPEPYVPCEPCTFGLGFPIAFTDVNAADATAATDDGNDAPAAAAPSSLDSG